jgi:hypothetical protein
LSGTPGHRGHRKGKPMGSPLRTRSQRNTRRKPTVEGGATKRQILSFTQRFWVAPTRWQVAHAKQQRSRSFTRASKSSHRFHRRQCAGSGWCPLWGETDTFGLIEAKSSQARRLCHRNHVTGTFSLRLAAFCHTSMEGIRRGRNVIAVIGKNKTQHRTTFCLTDH